MKATVKRTDYSLEITPERKPEFGGVIIQTLPVDLLAYVPDPKMILSEDEVVNADVEVENIRLPNGVVIPIYRRIVLEGGIELVNIR